MLNELSYFIQVIGPIENVSVFLKGWYQYHEGEKMLSVFSQWGLRKIFHFEWTKVLILSSSKKNKLSTNYQ